MKRHLFLTGWVICSLLIALGVEARGAAESDLWSMAVPGLPMIQHSSGDLAGHYYTAEGGDAQAWAQNLGEVKPPPGLGSRYICPASQQSGNPPNDKPSYGPFVGDGFSSGLGPVGSSKVWTSFAAWNSGTQALPLPLAIQASPNGFSFSRPPVFNAGNTYIAQLPRNDTQKPAQYYGAFSNDLTVAPCADGINAVTFTQPAPGGTPFTKLEGFSDWAASVSLTDASHRGMTLTFANGSPSAFLDFTTSYAFVRPVTSAERPLHFWFPQGYVSSVPPGVYIMVGGSNPTTSYDLKVTVTWNGKPATASHQTTKDEDNQTAAQGLATAVKTAMNDMVNVEAVEQVGTSTSYRFKIWAKGSTQSNHLQTSNVTATPVSDQPRILVCSDAPGSAAQPTGNILGITVNSEAIGPDNAKHPYYSSYALVAPKGATWKVAEGMASLICDFSTADNGSKSISVVAMPDVSGDQYADYDNQAKATLQAFWNAMQGYAYGCPRHMTGGKDDGTGTQLGPNSGKQFTPQIAVSAGGTQVTTEFHYNLSYPLGQPGGAAGVLFGLFPHQWRAYANSTASLLTSGGAELVYTTVMGTLKLGAFNGTGTLAFQTTHTFPGVLMALPNVVGLTGAESLKVADYPGGVGAAPKTRTLEEQMLQDAEKPIWSADLSAAGGAKDDYIPIQPVHQDNTSLGSYDWGKYVAGVADLIQPAHILGNTAAVDAAVSQTNAQLSQWLSGDLLGADATTPWPTGVQAWQESQGNTQFADSQGKVGLYPNQQFLYYDQQWCSFIPYPAGYYAENRLNDHHFHYGYWLRAAAQLAMAQKMGLDTSGNDFIADYGATVNLIIKDIANPLRGDTGAVGAAAKSFPSGPKTPFLRYFDGYFGHAWASGTPENIVNQESHSEAMSAWTGIILWGQMTGNQQMRDLGIWMYTLSRFAFYEYWMDCGQNGGTGSILFKTQSPNMQGAAGDAYRASLKAHATAPIGFATQVYNSYLQVVSDFGFEPVYLTGISWLPFHGGSFYLSSTDAAVKKTLGSVYDWAYDNSKYQWDNKGTLNYFQPTLWGVTWEPVAYNFLAMLGRNTHGSDLWGDADSGTGLEAAVGSTRPSANVSSWKPLGGQSVSYSYYWIYNMVEAELRDEGVTADWPFALKFESGQEDYYVAWNLTNSPITVTFSDRHQLKGVPAWGMSWGGVPHHR